MPTRKTETYFDHKTWKQKEKLSQYEQKRNCLRKSQKQKEIQTEREKDRLKQVYFDGWKGRGRN